MESRISRKTFQSRFDEMMRQLHQGIASGHYAPGSYLPAESALAQQFSLSNKSVRKGLEQLAEDGLIQKINKVGNRVAERAERPQAIVTLGYTATIERDYELAHLIADFESLHPWIKVQTVQYTAEPYTPPNSFCKLIRSYLDNSIFDVITLNQNNFQELHENNMISLLEPLQPEGGEYGFLTSAFTHHGQLFVQPIAFSPVVLCYNRRHFSQLDLPEPDSSWTWRELQRCSDIIADPEARYGFYFYLMSENRWPIFLLQSEPGRSGHAASGHEWLNGIRLVQRLIQNDRSYPGFITESSDDVNSLFLQGKVSMIVSSYFGMNDFKNTDIDYDVAPLPYLDRPATLQIISGMAISRKAKQKEEARLLAAYFASPRAQQLIRDLTLSIPANKKIAEAPPAPDAAKLNRPPHEAMFRELFPTLKLHRDLGLSVANQHALRVLMKQFWSGMIDEAALANQLEMLKRGSEGGQARG